MSEKVVDLSNKKFLSVSEAAQFSGLAEGTLSNYRTRRVGPKFYKTGRRVLYRRDELEAWLSRNPVMTILEV